VFYFVIPTEGAIKLAESSSKGYLWLAPVAKFKVTNLSFRA